MLTEFRIQTETPLLVHAVAYEREDDAAPWRERGGDKNGGVSWIKASLWFDGLPRDVLASLGVVCTDAKRAVDLINLFDGELGGFYYVAEASPPGSEEAIKWILGGLATHLNEKKLSFRDRNHVLPADHLRTFCEYLEAEKFARNFAKDVFAALLVADRFEMAPSGRFSQYLVNPGTNMPCNISDLSWDQYEEFVDLGCRITTLQQEDVVRRFTGAEILDTIIAQPRFKTIDTSEIDTLIEQVIAANPKEVEKARANPRAVNWFVGAVMKASKGKANAVIVQERLKDHFPS